ncbi:MAG: hypothetical protein J0L95_10505 [Candidatus Accumulibacter sp.]|uniref:hypothetical protein n=1 Tax=Betaproteobacteria TaxID=28216 RepID=UPI001AC2B7AB|nr:MULTISPECIES: hypothetical protein [Betaproteobacteria]MBN8438460.1 hypothetical protein [Accumulibacter sp.]MBN8473168.1 hypothetical protein [Sulfuritalea sp.]
MKNSNDLRGKRLIEERTRDNGLKPRAFPEGIIALVDLSERAARRGTIPLFHLLQLVSAGGGPVLDPVDDKYIERRNLILDDWVNGIGHLLWVAKRDIRDGKLKIFHLPSLIQINDVPEIVVWLDEPHALEVDLPKMMDRIGRLGGVVVKIEDAHQWINERCLTVSESLRDIFSVAVDDGGDVADDKQSDGHDPRTMKFLEAGKALWKAYDPADPSTAPKSSYVVKTLRDLGATLSKAQSVDKLLRPQGIKPGPRGRRQEK